MKTIVNLPRIRLGITGHTSKKGWIGGIMLRLNFRKLMRKAGQPIRRVKLKFKSCLFSTRLTIKEKIDLGNEWHSRIGSDPLFGTPYPSMKTLRSVTQALEGAYYNYLHGGEAERLELKDKLETFDIVFNGVVNYLDELAAGRKEIYDKAGIPCEVFRSRRNKRK